MPAAPLPVLTSAEADRRAIDRHLRRWLRLAPAGLATVGLGASLIGEATLRKGRGEPFVLYGTVALCVLNAGLCLFGEGVKQRALADWREQAAERP